MDMCELEQKKELLHKNILDLLRQKTNLQLMYRVLNQIFRIQVQTNVQVRQCVTSGSRCVVYCHSVFSADVLKTQSPSILPTQVHYLEICLAATRKLRPISPLLAGAWLSADSALSSHSTTSSRLMKSKTRLGSSILEMST